MNQIGLITNEVYFLSLTGSATWLKSFSLRTSNNNTSDDEPSSHTNISNQAIIGITIALVLIVSSVTLPIFFSYNYFK